MEKTDKRRRKVIEAIANLNEKDFNTIVFFLLGDVREVYDAEKILRKMRMSLNGVH